MHYLEVSLNSSKESNTNPTATTLKTQLNLAVKELLGTEGALCKVDILKYEPLKNKFILRCDSDSYVRLRAALTLSSFENNQYSFHVLKASPNLMSFTANRNTEAHFPTIMSVVRKEGKDTIIFATKEDHSTPSKVILPEPEPSPGLILPSGQINWNCPCLGGMATGPCGVEFREAFSCFHYSEADPKGSDCFEAFKTMQACMSNYPALYVNKEADLDELDNIDDLGDDDDSKKNLSNRSTSTEVKNEVEKSVTSSSKQVELTKVQ